MKAFAAEPAKEIIELTPYTVVGSRLPSSDHGLAIIIDRKEIELRGATRLEELIAQLPWNYGGAATGAATVPNGAPSYGTANAFFNFSGASAPLAQTGVSAAGLSGLGASGTLLLIDGRRVPLSTQGDTANATGAGFYNLSAIPLGFVDHIEVLPDSASAIYGSDAIGGVINVVLKQDYTGGELATTLKGTSRGGGFERTSTLTFGRTTGRFSVMLGASYYLRDALRASRRSFSANQDHTPQGGFNYQPSVGSPAVISAAVGTLNGLVLPSGGTTRFALVRTGLNGNSPTLTDFEPVSAFGVSNLRRYNTADAKDLIGSLEQSGFMLSSAYEWLPSISAFADASYSRQTSLTANEPPATLGGGFGGTNSRVLASDPRNPFGQDVIVSLVHVEAPPRPQTVDVTTQRITTGLRSTGTHNWRWQSSVSLARENFASHTLELRSALLVAALADGRFNPFGDPAAGPINASLYQELMVPAAITGSSRLTSADFDVNGHLLDLPGGPMAIAAGVTAEHAARHRQSTQPRFGEEATRDTTRNTTAFYAETSTPLFGAANARTGLRRLDLKLAGRAERTGSFHGILPRYAIVWSPSSPVTFRASYSAGLRAPSLSEFEQSVTTGTVTINDPLLNQSYPVPVVRGSNPSVQAEHSRHWQFGLTVRPDFLPGLTFQATSRETYYENKLTVVPDQTLVNYSGQFPERVSRDTTGRITLIDSTTINFGKIYSHSVDLRLAWQHEFASTGTWRLQVDAVRQLHYRTELVPGRPSVTVVGGTDTLSPPNWSADASLWWERDHWHAGIQAHFIDGYASNGTGPFLDQATTTPSWTTLDLRFGYRFMRGLWRGYGRDLRLQIGIGNITDRDPPFANTAYGYNQSLHNPLGRTYEFSARLPF